MSSTVHLITLSFLKNWLAQRPLLRNLRLLGMFILLAFLSVALFPQESQHFIDASRWQYGTPVRCYWNGQLGYERGPILRWNRDIVISYLFLSIGYAWKVSQVFDKSRVWLRRSLYARPVSALEQVAARYARRSPKTLSPAWVLLELLYYCYIMLVLLHQTIDSFMATILFLCMSLAWGTEQLLLVRATSLPEVARAENMLSFGQLVALLLLLQPLSLIIHYFARKGMFLTIYLSFEFRANSHSSIYNSNSYTSCHDGCIAFCKPRLKSLTRTQKAHYNACRCKHFCSDRSSQFDPDPQHEQSSHSRG